MAYRNPRKIPMIVFDTPDYDIGAKYFDTEHKEIKKLIEIRKHRYPKVSAKDFAKLSGGRPRQVTWPEEGEINSLTIRALLAYAQLFGGTISVLFKIGDDIYELHPVVAEAEDDSDEVDTAKGNPQVGDN